MAKRPASGMLQELSQETYLSTETSRASKRRRVEDSKLERRHLRQHSAPPACPPGSASQVGRKRTAAGDLNASRSKKPRTGGGSKPRRSADTTARSWTPVSNASGRDSDDRIIEAIVQAAREKAGDEVRQYHYPLIDTRREGTHPYGTEDWRLQQLGWRQIQYRAIRCLKTPESRNDPLYGLFGERFTAERYWMKRLEAIRLIGMGESPWHLEFAGPPCIRWLDEYRQPDTRPPIIPDSYRESDAKTLAVIQRRLEARRRELEQQRAEREEGGRQQQLAEEPLERKGRHAAKEFTEVRHQPPPSEELPEADGEPRPAEESAKADHSRLHRRSTRRKPATEMWELDSRGKGQIVASV